MKLCTYSPQLLQFFFALLFLTVINFFYLGQQDIIYDGMFNVNYLTFYVLFFFSIHLILIHCRKNLNSYLLITFLCIAYILSTFLASITGQNIIIVVLLIIISLVFILFFLILFSSKGNLTKINVFTNAGSFFSYIIIYYALTYLIVFFLDEIEILLNSIKLMTFYLLEPNFIVNHFLLLMSCLLLKYLTKLRLLDILKKSGLLNKRNFIEAAIIFLLIFSLLHIQIWLFTFSSNESLVSILNSTQLTLNEWLGLYIGQIFGTALQEEFIFRFIVFWSFFHLIKTKNNYTRLLCSLITTQLLFGLFHIPIIDFDYSLAFLFTIFVPYLFIGMILSFLYLYTKNLWIPIFIHGLYNTDLPLFIPSNYDHLIPYLNFRYIILVFTLFIVTVLVTSRSKEMSKE
ncbi:CPBP family intramembrane glutamic endopeptidase [Evansella halocellulosilytica]|uniref:CPBP family intramembrane glutamic endopeptidase n=1 Tax=Evansella halocellulosilytica TaxID=2011013 RepID=UPI000BB7A1C3